MHQEAVAHGIDHDQMMQMGGPFQSDRELNYDRVLKSINKNVDQLIEACIFRCYHSKQRVQDRSWERCPE